MTDTRNLVLLGLPQTGKSTYLGTLWHMVEEPDVTEVVISDHPADLAHVRKLAHAVRGLDEMPRTRSADHEEFNVPVRFADGKEADLRIPDLSGEHLLAILEQRTLPEVLRQELDDAPGLLLFVHPSNTIQPRGLAVVGAPDAEDEVVAADVHDDVALANTEDRLVLPGDDGEPAASFENQNACTAAQLVDCIENTLEVMSGSWPVRLAIVISAFDLAAEQTPDEWLKHRLPAVRSFLELNDDRLVWTVFGVSAQGGRRRDKEILLDDDLHERAYARDRQGDKVGFSDPVRWALGWH